MKQLETSGLPIYMDEQNKLTFHESLILTGEGSKCANQMRDLFMDPSYLADEEPYYDVYRGISKTGDEKLFARNKKRYDITAIMENTVDGECKKTTGHFHCYLPGKHISYPEVYEVLSGKALYFLVKVKDHTVPVDQLEVEDIRLAIVEEGEVIIIPPNYGHAAVNIGEGPMIFSNICTLENTSDYSIVKFYHGMPYYITKVNGKIIPVKNKNWKMDLPDPKFVRVKEAPDLGIYFNNPVYNEFIKSPGTFSFLENPVGHVDEIMDMLIEVKEGI